MFGPLRYKFTVKKPGVNFDLTRNKFAHNHAHFRRFKNYDATMIERKIFMLEAKLESEL